MNTRELKHKLSTFDPNESFYWHVCDGHCSGTEFAWLPSANKWMWYDLDGSQAGQSDVLTIIQSSVDGDESGLNQLADLVTVELDGDTGTWIVALGEEDLSGLPDDSEVWAIDCLGVKEVSLVEDTGA